MATVRHNVIQGTEEWHNLRGKMFTASNAKRVVTTTLKVANNQDVRAYVAEVAGYRMYPFAEDNFTSFAMERGHIEEALARAKYQEIYGHVEQVGFITNDFIGFDIGYSPDGIVDGGRGGIEVKSRKRGLHMVTMATNTVPDEYMAQIQAGLLIGALAYIDFISYSGGLPMVVIRVHRDTAYINALLEAISGFEDAVNQTIKSCKINIKNHGWLNTERTVYDLEVSDGE